MMQNYDHLECDLRTVHYTFKMHRGFKKLLRMQTEHTAESGAYEKFWAPLLETELKRRMIKNGPTMRIAFLNSKHDYYNFWDNIVTIQNDRIIFKTGAHNAYFLISFDVHTFFLFMIQYDLKDYMPNHIMKSIITLYMWEMRNQLLDECPTRQVLKKDFTLPWDCTSNDEIMLRFTEVCTKYMRYKVVGKLKPGRKKQQAN